MGTVTPNKVGLASLVTLSISLLSCLSPNEVSGIYQKRDDARNYGFGFTTLILRKDNTFLYHDYSDELCYQTNFGACGNWIINNDTIHLKLFDTISMHIQYLPDSSDQLTLEVFDNYDCQYLLPSFFMDDFGSGFKTIGFGYFRGDISPDINAILFHTSNYLTSTPIEIKPDSMHVQIHGMNMGYSRYIEKIAFVRKKSDLILLDDCKKSKYVRCPTPRFYRKENLEYFHYIYN
jgi:hypothetical protein